MTPITFTVGETTTLALVHLAKACITNARGSLQPARRRKWKEEASIVVAELERRRHAPKVTIQLRNSIALS